MHFKNYHLREPKYEDLNLRADCQDQHTTYDSLKNDKSAVMHNGINNVTKMGGAKSKLNIDGMLIGKTNQIQKHCQNVIL